MWQVRQELEFRVHLNGDVVLETPLCLGWNLQGLIPEVRVNWELTSYWRVLQFKILSISIHEIWEGCMQVSCLGRDSLVMGKLDPLLKILLCLFSMWVEHCSIQYSITLCFPFWLWYQDAVGRSAETFIPGDRQQMSFASNPDFLNFYLMSFFYSRILYRIPHYI